MHGRHKLNLSIPSISRPYNRGIGSGSGGHTNITSPSKDEGKYFTLHNLIFPKSIEARYDFDHFFDLVHFNASTICKTNDEDKDNAKRDVMKMKKTNHISCIGVRLEDGFLY